MKAAVDDRVVVDVANLEAPAGSTTLTLVYDGDEGPSEIVTIILPEPPPVPAELEIADFVIDPPSPVQSRETQAIITVCNRGGSLAPGFVVQWKPTADNAGLSFRVSGADVGECQEAPFSFVYPSSGAFDTVAIMDALNQVDETDEANNSSIRSITVEPEDESPPPSEPPTPRPPFPEESLPPCDPPFTNCPQPR